MKIIFLSLVAGFLLSVPLLSATAQDTPDPLTTTLDVIPRQEILRLGRGAARDAVWLPDGGVAVMSDQGIWLYDATFADRGFLPDILNSVWWGDRLAAVEAGQTLSLYHLQPDATLSLVWSLPIEQPIHLLVWHPDGDRLAAVYREGTIEIRGASTGEVIQHFSAEPFTALVWLDDYLAAGDAEGYVHILSAETGAVLQSFRAHQDAVRAMSASAGGLATGGTDGSIEVWHIPDLNTPPAAPTMTLTGHTERLHSLAWHPDGMRLLSTAGHQFVGGEVRVWDTVSGRASNLFSGNAAMITARWNADGSRLLAVGGWHD